MKKLNIKTNTDNFSKYALIVLLGLVFLFIIICIYDYLPNKQSSLLLDRWDWFALIVASFSLFFTALTWRSQEQTRENTKRLTPERYRKLLTDNYYSIVRNTIYIYSLAETLEEKYADFYPSEEYLQKLKLYLFDESEVSSQDLDGIAPGRIQRTQELCHFFNLQIDSSQRHLSSPNIGEDIKKRDMASLKNLHWLVASEIMATIDEICPDTKEANHQGVFKELRSEADRQCKVLGSSDSLKDIQYIRKDNIKFLGNTCSEAEYQEILKNLNTAIQLHQGNRMDGYPRVPLIPLR